MTRRSVPIALALTVALLAPSSGHAIDQPGCHGNYDAAANCQFLFRGFPVHVFGQANTTGAPVHVWITIDGYPEIVLLECAGAGRCEDDVHAEGYLEQIPPQVPTIRLRCYVQGQGTGFYSCGSGKYQPPGA